MGAGNPPPTTHAGLLRWSLTAKVFLGKKSRLGCRVGARRRSCPRLSLASCEADCLQGGARRLEPASSQTRTLGRLSVPSPLSITPYDRWKCSLVVDGRRACRDCGSSSCPSVTQRICCVTPISSKQIGLLSSACGTPARCAICHVADMARSGVKCRLSAFGVLRARRLRIRPRGSVRHSRGPRPSRYSACRRSPPRASCAACR